MRTPALSIAGGYGYVQGGPGVAGGSGQRQLNDASHYTRADPMFSQAEEATTLATVTMWRGVGA